MSASFDIDDIQVYQDYVEDFNYDLMSKMFLSNDTAKIVTPHEGLRGKLTLTEMVVGNLVQVWTKDFNPTQGAIKFKPRTLETYLVKVDTSFVPQELAKSYLGKARAANASPEDLPFPQYVTNGITSQIAQENELAAWRANRPVDPAAGALLDAVVNGYQTICANETAAGNLTPVVTGAITNTNAIENARKVYKAMSPVYQKQNLTAFVSPDHMLKLQEDYQERYGKLIGQDGKGFKFGIGLGNGGVTFRSHAGIQGDFLMMTPLSNLHMGYAEEGSLLRFFEDVRLIKVVADYWIGFQIAIVDDSILRTNDQ